MITRTTRSQGWTRRSGRLLGVVALLVAAPTLAQHHGDHGGGETETFVVKGLRIDAESPPPGSGVGRAGARLAGGGYLHVVYGKPYARGRMIFGGLVAYDQIWATGAHVSSELAVTVPVTVGGHDLEPGVYSLFTTPGKTTWTLHLNRVLGAHLADEYDPKQDVLVAEAASQTLDEAVPDLTLDFEATDGGALLRITWDKTRVSFPIRKR